MIEIKYLLVSAEHECINASHHLIHVTSHTGRVVKRQFQLLVRTNDEHSPGSRLEIAKGTGHVASHYWTL